MRNLFPCLCLLVFTGCSTRLGDFTAISTKSVSFEGTRGERVRGEEKQRHIFTFPLDGTPTWKGAIDRALESGNCDLLMDAVLYTKFGGFPFLYMENGFMVEGTCVRMRGQEAPPVSPEPERVYPFRGPRKQQDIGD